MRLRKSFFTLIATSLLATTPAFAEGQNVIDSPSKKSLSQIDHNVTKYTALEILKEKGVKETLEEIYNIFPETKSFTITLPYKIKTVSPLNDVVEFNKYYMSLKGSTYRD